MALRIGLVFLFLAASNVFASRLEEQITAEAVLVTKAELQRHFSSSNSPVWQSSTYVALAAAPDTDPNYLVVRFRADVPGHYTGEAEVRIDGARGGTKLNVALHYNPGWVEYFIPQDGVVFSLPDKMGSPSLEVSWNRLRVK